MVEMINTIKWNANDFYTTIHRFHNKSGLQVLIHGEISDNYDKLQLQLDYQALDPLKKVIMSRSDDLGNTVQYEEENPEKIPDSARSWINMTEDQKGANEFVVFPNSRLFPLINYAFIEADVIQKGNIKGFAFDWDELEKPIDHIKCKLKVEQRKGIKQPYYVPVPVMEE